MPKNTGLYASSIIIFLYPVLLAVSLVVTTPLINYDTGQIQDFSYCFEFFSRFIIRPFVDYYKLEVQQQVISSVFGRPLAEVMPIGWTPSSFLLFAPLAALYSVRPGLAYLSFISISSFVFAWGWLEINKSSKNSSGRYCAYFTTICLLLFSCQTVREGIALGQFSLLALGSLLLLNSVSSKTTSFYKSLRVVLTLALSTKPLYFAAVTLLLCVQGHRKTALLSTLLVAFLSITALTIMDQNALHSYLSGLSAFANLHPSPYYALAFNAERIPTFTNAFKDIIGAERSLFLSKVLFYSNFLIVVMFAVRNTSYHKFSQSLLLTYGLGTMLLFMPYVGSYDIFLLAFPLITSFHFNFPIYFIGAMSCLTLLMLYVSNAQAVWLSELMVFMLFMCLALFKRWRHFPQTKDEPVNKTKLVVGVVSHPGSF